MAYCQFMTNTMGYFYISLDTDNSRSHSLIDNIRIISDKDLKPTLTPRWATKYKSNINHIKIINCVYVTVR